MVNYAAIVVYGCLALFLFFYFRWLRNFGKRRNKPVAAPPSGEGIIVSDVFTFEHRNSKGKLIATNKDLKPKNNIRERLKRLLNLA